MPRAISHKFVFVPSSKAVLLFASTPTVGHAPCHAALFISLKIRPVGARTARCLRLLLAPLIASCAYRLDLLREFTLKIAHQSNQTRRFTDIFSNLFKDGLKLAGLNLVVL